MAQNYHPICQTSHSAGMAPFSTFSGPIPRFQNTEEGKSSTILPLQTQALRTGYFHLFQNGIKAELDRGLRDHIGQPFYFIDEGTCVEFLPKVTQQVYGRAETITRFPDFQSRMLTTLFE